MGSYPDVPETISLFQAQVWVPRTAISLNLASPIPPANRLQLFCAQDQPDRDDNDSCQGLDNDIMREGEARVTE